MIKKYNFEKEINNNLIILRNIIFGHLYILNFYELYGKAKYGRICILIILTKEYKIKVNVTVTLLNVVPYLGWSWLFCCGSE